MPGKKTLEEIRASNRERQRRYKERHGWVAKAKARESMAALRARRRGESDGGPVANDNADVANKGLLGDNAPVPWETYYADEEGVDIGYTDARRPARGPGINRGRDGVEATGVGEEDSEVGRGDRESAGLLARGAGEDTMRAVERLMELVKRQAAGRLNAGVEVELEI